MDDNDGKGPCPEDRLALDLVNMDIFETSMYGEIERQVFAT